MIIAVYKSTNKVVNDIQSESGKNVDSFKSNILSCFGGNIDDYHWVEPYMEDIDMLFKNEPIEGLVIDYNNIIYNFETQRCIFSYINPPEE